MGHTVNYQYMVVVRVDEDTWRNDPEATQALKDGLRTDIEDSVKGMAKRLGINAEFVSMYDAGICR